MMSVRFIFAASLASSLAAAAATAAEPITTLANSSVSFKAADQSYVILKRGDITAVVADNRAVDDDVLAGHRAGYSGIASLTHRIRSENLFVPSVAGLNFEHILDGTIQEREVLFEPRHFPMELRIIDEHTAELYQAPSPHYGLESCLRYRLLDGGAIEMTLECIPRRRSFRHNYIGLFWASYIHQPESLDIYFKKFRANQAPAWVRGVTPEHGVRSTHLGSSDSREFEHAPDFPLKLVFNRSEHRYAEPWYYGVSHKMALVQMFRPQDEIRLTQSPSGGGSGNPAWDFQFLIDDYQIGERYQMVMRAMYLPFESREQIELATRPHRLALGGEAAKK
jgi:hypothetical protein